MNNHLLSVSPIEKRVNREYEGEKILRTFQRLQQYGDSIIILI